MDGDRIAPSLYPTHLPIGRYAVTLEALDPVELSHFSAATLRGAFGWSFKRMVCYQPQVERCDGCLLRAQCPYPPVFEPRPAAGTIFHAGSDAPSPYVLRPPTDERRLFQAGERFRFEVVLMGDAIGLLPYFAVALQQLEESGVGRRRGRVRVTRIEALTPKEADGETVFDEREPDVIYPHRGLPAVDWLSGEAPPDEVTIEFLTLMRLKSQGKVQKTPEFHVLYRALLRRVSALCSTHTDTPWETDFRALAEASHTVETAAVNLRGARRRRHSTRQGRTVEMWGSLGNVVYRGDLAQFWPLLELGQLLHVGKGCTFGLGRYRIGHGEL